MALSLTPNPYSLIPLLLLLLAVPTIAQETGGPKLDVETVTVVGKRVITLPKARKGEVLDTSVYRLSAVDTMLFGERISNLGGSGGALPAWRELASPLRVNYEASLGSYISPHLLAQAEYLQKTYSLTGVVDYLGTMGHIDSAKASSLLLGAHGSVLVGGGGDGPPRSRISGDFDYMGDSYFLYGSTASPYDRSRAGMRLNLGLQSQEDGLVDYGLNVEVANTSLEDRLRDSVADASALSAGGGFMLSLGTDSLRGRLRLDYISTSLHYGVPTNSPAYIGIQVNGDWAMVPKFFLSLGALYANGQHSDSGSTTLATVRASARYELNETISLFGWFTPELRAASYRNRIMQAPYVDRAIELKPERVPVRFAGGVRLTTEPMVIEARAIFEKAENTPVVVADTTPGRLMYAHVDSRSVGAEGSIQLRVIPNIEIEGDAVIRSAVIDSSGDQLPMTPQVDLRGRINYKLTPEIGLFGSLAFLSSQRTAINDSNVVEDLRTIPAQVLLGGGGSYRIAESIELFAEVSNLLNLKYDLWQNYSAPGFEIRGGVRGRF